MPTLPGTTLTQRLLAADSWANAAVEPMRTKDNHWILRESQALNSSGLFAGKCRFGFVPGESGTFKVHVIDEQTGSLDSGTQTVLSRGKSNIAAWSRMVMTRE